jgi:twitching motility protein PilI
VPYTQDWFLGVANLRGGLFGVVDLASYVSGKRRRPKNRLGRAESRLVALNALLEVNCALLIDRSPACATRTRSAISPKKRPTLPISSATVCTDPTARTGRKSTCSCLRNNRIS